MSTGEHKVFDLELVGVPVRKRRPWLYTIAGFGGVLVGALLMSVLGWNTPSEAPMDEASEENAMSLVSGRSGEFAKMRTRISSLDSEVQAARAELLRVRNDHDQLVRAYGRLKQENAQIEAELATARAQLARRVPTVNAPRPSAPVRRDLDAPTREEPGIPLAPASPAVTQPWAPRLGDERSPRPLASPETLSDTSESDDQEARRIFVVPMAGIRLADVARLYDVSVRRLRQVNPELEAPDEGFLREGARVRIPNAVQQ